MTETTLPVVPCCAASPLRDAQPRILLVSLFTPLAQGFAGTEKGAASMVLPTDRHDVVNDGG